MAEEALVNRYCLDEEGFPELLRDTAFRLGISEHPEYEGREYEEYGTQRCEVTIHVGRSKEFPDIRPWRVSMIGFQFADTYQAAARKALRYLCQIYERPIAHTPMRLFPPLLRDTPVWKSPERYNQQARRLKRCIREAEEAEVQIRQLRIRVTEAHARAAAAENHEAIAVEALKLEEDRHTQQLKDAYLITQAKRRMIITDGQQHTVLDGIPITFVGKPGEGPSAPPPTEVSLEASEADVAEEEPLPLTQKVKE
ncbi:uncharacterized protein C2845_PM13G05080 [Panicum miliaceum]|uniref:Uncharacterized protein n=1 Tax=Panicum miliaceum TaxID=4540 RepID=A0A3L6RJI5_PANMI|nr:uncharacterized protein C2845_PM13G05080 [Panicum miliaceum]